MSSHSDTRATRYAFVQVTSLFFAWGFITATIDPLIPAVRAVFELSHTESLLTQFAVFIAYGLVSLPSAALVARLGQANGVIVALSVMLLGCLAVPLAATTGLYAALLLALFVIASGITLLQVAANPLAASLGLPNSSHSRLTLAQAINSLGTVVAPMIGATLMLRGGVFDGGSIDAASRATSLQAIGTNFMLIAALLAIITGLFWRIRKPVAALAMTDTTVASPLAALKSRWACFGAAAIFLYVGAEVAIGSIMISFLTQSSILGVTHERAGFLVSLYWLGAMIGRFAGSALLTRIAAGRLLALACAAAALLCLIVTQTTGYTAAIAALAIGSFNSIMFPTIFTLTLARAQAPIASTSGLLCTAIVGGAILPLVTGVLADKMDISSAFIVPLIAYMLILVFAMRVGNSSSTSDLSPISH